LFGVGPAVGKWAASLIPFTRDERSFSAASVRDDGFLKLTMARDFHKVALHQFFPEEGEKDWL
jgi:hypothetical protein